MQKIIADLKSGDLKQIYLLYGQEAYLRKQYRDKLRDALVPEGDTMNYKYYEGKNISVGEVIDLAETMPFFADRRVIFIENSELFKKGGEAMAEYLDAPAETTFFVFVEEEIDKRSKLFKAVQKKGVVSELTTQDENTLVRWIYSLIKKEGKQVNEQTLHYFLAKVGTDMSNIRTEVEKVLCYCLQRDIVTMEDIDAVCVKQITNQIFDMVAAIAERKQSTALDLYYDLLTLKEAPLRILFLIARQFNLLLQTKELMLKGYGDRAIADKIGLTSYVAGKYIRQASRLKLDYLKKAVEDCVRAEEAVKTGKMSDVMSVELIIVQYSAGLE